MAPPPPAATTDKPASAGASGARTAPPAVREANDAADHRELARDPGHTASKLDVGLDESFPSSDPAAATQPGHADPPPSSGYDEQAEKAREKAQ